ncbi:uncharacterized protein LOC126368613 isoform X2 [Pectinophora gossypiella]|uniref:uncharacterized protein LOC126368613 isoform X2 n=1 Tax=Pectinophora gossypiella TaxID=13191 RepID=UPI00214E7726|nr:uncharacterized protein LOC126368613 isoform X2 [Pectinophora gossypiella]
MSDKENKRKCFKCGSSPAEDGIKLFRALKPGTNNLVRCEQWAQYMYPGRNVSSVEFLKKIYNEHRMLCSKHFQEEDFTDLTRKYLLRTAVPRDIEQQELGQPGPSRSTNEACIEAGSRKPKTKKEQILQSKCMKYLQKICVLQKRVQALSAQTMLNAIADDNNVKKLSAKVTPAFALFLQGQIRNCNRKLRGRRWSREEKITALRIFKRSPTCYRLLRRLFTLPSPGTLKNLLSKIPFTVGCNEAVFKIMQKFVKSQKTTDNEYILMFDEMSLKKHLNYDCKSDLIEGFQDHGNQGRSENIAGYALVFMVGGIRKRVKQPIAHYFSSSFVTADRLAILIKEVLKRCFEAGVNISATVCDMDGVNRRALSNLGATPENPSIKIGDKEIVTLYDTPHLLKCFRNLFIKYDIEYSSNIHSTGKTGRGVAKWSHISQFFQIDNTNPNFVFAPCLKKDHLNPNNKQKMKVNLAAQVLSHSVAAGMFARISTGELPAEAALTADLVSNMDKLFDSLNSEQADLRRGKPHATNLSQTSPHIEHFKKMKVLFSDLTFVGCSRKPPSQEGWIWTINGVEILWQKLSNNKKKLSLATRRLQQDPLENLFGCIRGYCGSNTNPTTGQFVAGLKTAILNNLSRVGTTGNCETDNNVVINNFETMLSVSKPTQVSTPNEFNYIELPPMEDALNEESGEIKACAYVCGFLIKQFPVTSCSLCERIFLTKDIENHHSFVEWREYSEKNRNLKYVTKNLVNCVECSATLINIFLNEKAHINEIKKNIYTNVKMSINFDFLNACTSHKETNIDSIINSVFFICMKRFCTLKNREFSEQASATALQRKMNIILHK